MKTALVSALCFVPFLLSVHAGDETKRYQYWQFDGKEKHSSYDVYVTAVSIAARILGDAQKNSESAIPYLQEELHFSLLAIGKQRARFLEDGESRQATMSEEERAQWKRVKEEVKSGSKVFTQQEIESMPEEEVRRRIKLEVKKLTSIPSCRYDWTQMYEEKRH